MNLSTELSLLEKEIIDIRKYLKELKDPINKEQSLEIRSRFTDILSRIINLKNSI